MQVQAAAVKELSTSRSFFNSRYVCFIYFSEYFFVIDQKSVFECINYNGMGLNTYTPKQMCTRTAEDTTKA